MSNQLFKKPIPIDLLFDLLNNICHKNNEYYTVDLNSYKKMLYHKYETEFCEKIKKYYHTSKMFYVNRKLTFNSFTNIVRQICKFNNIKFTYNVKYSEYKYNIVYKIYFDGSQPEEENENPENTENKADKNK